MLASSQPRDVASGDARLPRDAKCASATCAPLRRRQVACLSRACPSAAAALLCHLGPLLHFKKSASGCCQPPPAGGPPTADLSNYTRRAGRRCPAPPGPVGRRAAGGGGQGICPLPGPPQRPPGVTPAGPAAQWQLSCSRPSALRAARNQRRAAVAGRGPRANPSHRTGDGRLRACPR